MPSTYSDLLGIENQATGENSATWGDIVDSNFELLEDAIAGGLVKSVAGSADVTLTDTNGATDEHRNMMHEYTGALTGNINVIVPDSSKLYFVYNNTSGAFTLTVKTAAGSGVAVLQGGRAILQADGTNVVLFDTTNVVGDTTPQLGGNLDLNGNDITGTGVIPAANLTGVMPAINGSNLTGIDTLPTQTGNAGKFLTTDATNPSWATLDTDANTTTKGLYENASVISANYTINASNNAMSAGAITINAGITVTIPATSTWTIL